MLLLLEVARLGLALRPQLPAGLPFDARSTAPKTPPPVVRPPPPVSSKDWNRGGKGQGIGAMQKPERDLLWVELEPGAQEMMEQGH